MERDHRTNFRKNSLEQKASSMTIRSFAATMGIVVVSAGLLLLWMNAADSCEYIGWLAPMPKTPAAPLDAHPVTVLDYPFGKCDRGAPLFLTVVIGVAALLFLLQGALVARFNRRR